MQVLKDEVRKQILQVAEKQFCLKGYLDTTTRSIANEVGISVSNLYLYYENKEKLFNAVADPIFHKFTSGFDQLINHKDKHDELNENISFIIGKMIAASQGSFLLIFEKSKGTKYEGFSEELISRVKRHVMDQLNQKVRDKELIAGVFATSLIEGIVAIVKSHRDEIHLEENLGLLTKFYTEGIKQFIK